MASKEHSVPTSHFPLPTCRAALTLTEVLIAMGVLTIGLLGVASVFPVGGFYMQSGDIADSGGAIAQAALEDAIIRGHLDPKNWVACDVNDNNGQFLRLVEGIGVSGGGVTFARVGLRASPAVAMATPTFSVGTTNTSDREQYKASLFGGAYVLDPLGIGSALNDANFGNQLVANSPFNRNVRHFPAFLNQGAPPGDRSPAWNPWMLQNDSWPVRRITTVHRTQRLNEAVVFKFQTPIAQATFGATDDLAETLPKDGDIPARQQMETWATSAAAFPSRRLARGDYSWIITIDFGSSRARDVLGTTPDAYPANVSAAVFHRRVLGRGFEGTLEAERLVEARVVSAGPSGGELLLERRVNLDDPSMPRSDDDPPDLGSPFEDLREGQFVLVMAPHPLSTPNEPRFALRWCRVLNIQEDGLPNLPGLSADRRRLSNDRRVLVALRSADWPWQPANDLSVETALSNDLRVAILPGVVAVHTKTMRLEAGSEWSID